MPRKLILSLMLVPLWMAPSSQSALLKLPQNSLKFVGKGSNPAPSLGSRALADRLPRLDGIQREPNLQIQHKIDPIAYIDFGPSHCCNNHPLLCGSAYFAVMFLYGSLSYRKQFERPLKEEDRAY